MDVPCQEPKPHLQCLEKDVMAFAKWRLLCRICRRLTSLTRLNQECWSLVSLLDKIEGSSSLGCAAAKARSILNPSIDNPSPWIFMNLIQTSSFREPYSKQLL